MLGGTNVGLVVANHTYMKINSGFGVGTKQETYGGKALRHAATLRLQLFNAGILKGSGGIIQGSEVGIKLIKNRIGNSFGETRVGLVRDYGFIDEWSLHQRLSAAGVIVTSGAWSSFLMGDEEIKYQGWMGLWTKCYERPEIKTYLIEQYRNLEM